MGCECAVREQPSDNCPEKDAGGSRPKSEANAANRDECYFGLGSRQHNQFVLDPPAISIVLGTLYWIFMGIIH